jgi:hypothetical protein
MPEPSQRTNQIIALAVFVSAIALGIVALLIFAGTIPVAAGTRPLIAAAVGAAAFADLAAAVWFFRKGQSS